MQGSIRKLTWYNTSSAIQFPIPEMKLCRDEQTDISIIVINRECPLQGRIPFHSYYSRTSSRCQAHMRSTLYIQIIASYISQSNHINL